jgi:hypothetical protein
MEIVWVTGIYLSLGPYLKSYALMKKTSLKQIKSALRICPLFIF